jgi:hypothetical protein
MYLVCDFRHVNIHALRQGLHFTGPLGLSSKGVASIAKQPSVRRGAP